MLTLQKAARPLKGTITVPGDKSITHRAIILGSLAKGKTEVRGFLKGDDCLSTIRCLSSLGIEMEEEEERLLVHGRGLYGLHAADLPLDAGNSATTTRLMTGILAAQPFSSEISGDASLNRRPMKRILHPLGQMGADIISKNRNDCCPLLIHGKELHGITYESPIPSAQVKSCILLAGLYCEEATAIIEETLSRNHTELLLPDLGAKIECRPLSDGRILTLLHPGSSLSASQIRIPGDFSSAAYFIAAALLVPGSEIRIRNVGINPTRTGFLQILHRMGAEIRLDNAVLASEPYADLIVRYSQLHGDTNGRITIGKKIIPTLIDELPLLAVIASLSECEMVLQDVAELRVKESDRIASTCENLKAMGADVLPCKDGMKICGHPCKSHPLHGATIDPHHDHRIALSFAVAALLADGETRIPDEDCIRISYPSFFTDLKKVLS